MYRKTELVIEKETFNSIKNDEKFILVINLGRYFNVLMSITQSYLEYNNDETSVGIRQKMFTLWISIGYLHEGLKLFQQLEKNFADDPIFTESIGKFIADPKLKDFNKKLADLRSNISFHFDNKKGNSKIIKQCLNNLDEDEYVLLSTDGKKSGDMHFILSDEINANYFLKNNKDKSQEEFIGDFLTEVSSNLNKTAEVLQEFIWNYMNSLLDTHSGFFTREVSEKTNTK